MVQGKLPGERLYLSYTEHGLLYCGSGEADGQECIYETEGVTVRGEEYGIYRIGLKNEK